MPESSRTGRRTPLRQAENAVRHGGAGHRLEAGNVPEGGFRVAIRLPFREAGTTAA